MPADRPVPEPAVVATPDLTRRQAVAALTAGFALAVQPVSAATITTSAEGLEAGEVEIPTSDGAIPAYRAAPATGGPFPTVLVVQEIFGVHEHIKDICRRFAQLGYVAIAPGFFLTDQNRGLLTQPDGSMTERGKTIIGHTPMGRYGKPEDLVGALLWLCSDEGAAFVTGTVVAIDGGFSAFSGV